MVKNKDLRIQITKLLYEEPEAFTSEQFFEIAGSKKIESDINKLNDFLKELNNRDLDPNTRRLIMQTRLKIKLAQKELNKSKTIIF